MTADSVAFQLLGRPQARAIQDALLKFLTHEIAVLSHEILDNLLYNNRSQNHIVSEFYFLLSDYFRI